MKQQSPDKTKIIELIKPDKKKLDKKPVYAYALKDKIFGEIKIKKSANAWWMDSGKIEVFIECLKRRMSPRQASIRAMISDDQLYYFLEIHPEFYQIIERSKEILNIKAKEGLTSLIEREDGATIRWFLENTEPGEYGKKPPVVAVQINMNEKVGKLREDYK